MKGRRLCRPFAAAAAALALSASAGALAQDAMKGGMLGGSDRDVLRDPVMFREQVLPLLEKHCLGCHERGDPDNETSHQLVGPKDGVFTDEAVERNYKSVVALLHPKDPARSRLLLKLVPLSRGGLDHDGGKADDEYFPSHMIDPKGPLVSWVFGGSKDDAPPVAVHGPVPRTVEVGSEVPLDGRLSFDPDEKDVTVAWELYEAPLGSRAKIGKADAKVTRIVPDRPGPYVVRMRPKDGKLVGWPALIRFSAVPKTTGPSIGDDVPAPVTTITTHERRRTRALFLDLLGRTPTAEELARVCALPYEERVDRLLADEASWKTWFDEEAFYFLLIDRFRPVSDRLSAVPARMAQGLTNFKEAHLEFALSAEFNARNPGNDTYVTVIFEQFLAIEVQKEQKLLKAAKKMYDGAPGKIFKQRGGNQSDVVQISLAQPGYVDVFVDRMAARYLGAPLPDDQRQLTADLLRMKPAEFKSVLREWLLSDAYAGEDRVTKAKNDHQFIRGLFVDLLGRAPAYEEFRNMRNALQAVADPGPVRGVLAKVMLDSGAVLEPTHTTKEPKKLVTEIFHRLLGRDPEPKEAAAFVQELLYGGASWRTCAMAILTSPHYQYY